MKLEGVSIKLSFIYRACSSVVERFVDIEEVISSILIMPTNFNFN